MARVTYDEVFKAEAVRLVTEENQPLKRVAESLGVTPQTLRSWRDQRIGRQAADTLPEHANRAQLEARVRQLERENRELRMQREILKKAATFFANESP